MQIQEPDTHQPDLLKSDAWSTKSKKEMVLGLTLLLAAIGIGPIFFALGDHLLFWISLIIIGCGGYGVLLGFLQP
jgi:hypothetical protein